MINQFTDQNQDQQFKDWLARHPDGFYLNERQRGNMISGQGQMMLHKVGCPHVGTGEGFITTTYAKAVSDDVDELIEWAKAKGLSIVNCSSCSPD
jgi:hypothetical protein